MTTEEEKRIREDERQYVLACVKDWLEIKNDNLKCDSCKYRNEKFPPGAQTTPADVDHSSLLGRILEGMKIHKNPPPLAFSYPADRLASGESCRVTSLHFSSWLAKELEKHDGTERVYIHQSAWNVVTKNDSEYILEWPETKEQYRLRKNRPEDGKPWNVLYDPEDDTRWVLEKMGEVEYLTPCARDYWVTKGREEHEKQWREKQGKDSV
jgi:hypothetical protein